MSAEVQLGRLKLKSLVMNAAGPWASTAKQLSALNDSQSGAVVTKTFTLAPLEGNSGVNQYFSEEFSINNVGLTNNGAEYFINAVRRLKKKKPFIASIFDSDTNQLVKLGRAVQEDFEAIELNVSCPNVKTKVSVAYDHKALDELLTAFLSQIKIPVSVKLPPYVLESHLARVAGVLDQHQLNHVVMLNTFPIASALVDGRPVITVNNGIGGLGGSFYKPIAAGHIILFKKYLPTLPVVAVGGITSGSDVKDFLSLGASAVQVGSFTQLEGVAGLNKLARQFS